MSRYIDADMLIAKYGKKLMCNDITSEEYYAIKIPLDYMPTADVVKVIRCKDCAWYVVNELKADGTTDNRYNPSLCEYLEFYTDKNDYCSFAERKKENEK